MKRLYTYVLALALMLASFALIPLAGLAQEDGGDRPFIKNPFENKPPKDTHEGITNTDWPLEPAVEGSKARGKVRLECFSDDKDSFRMDAQGLEPKKVYTLWFVSSLKDGADRAGIGKEPFGFKSSGSGKALYQAPLKTCPLIKWRWVEVREHPDGDAANLEQSVRVLKARLHPQ